MKYQLFGILFLIPSLFQSSSMTLNAKESVDYILNNEKIIIEGMDIQNLSTDQELMNVIQDENTNEIIIQLKLNYRYLTTNANLPESCSEGEADTYLQTRRNSGKTFHSQKNQKFVSDYQMSGFNNLYYSKYGPFIEYTIPANELVANNFSALSSFINSSYVDKIYIEANEVFEKREQVEYECRSIGVFDYLLNQTFTGVGVKVGVLECGIINENYAKLANTNKVVRKEWYYIETVTDHATQVASIIAGEYGIAPDATILSVEVSGTPNSEIDWLLDQGVNVVNMSYGDARPSGKYAYDSAYMDYICYTYLITFVGSVGNEGVNGNVGNPSLGYNVIGVGASDELDGSLVSFTSTNVVKGPKKPNVLAPGLDVFNGGNTGTSFSAPLVSGSIALLMEYKPVLKTNPQRVMALVMANAKDTPYLDFTDGLNEYAGAGNFRFDNIIDNYAKCFDLTNTSETEYSWPLRSVTLPAGKTIRVALVWLAYSTGSTSSLKITDYNMVLQRTDGIFFSESVYPDNNIEFIEYTSTATIDQPLRVYVTLNGTRKVNVSEKLTIAYRIY